MSELDLGQIDAALAASLNGSLDEVEKLLRSSLESDYPFVTDASRHLVEAGGKRFRPLLVLLASHFGDPLADGVVPAAVVVELTHLATLYHDDVMDEAELRRGAPSANARWGNTVAILTGDFLFSRASELLADLGPEAVRIQARTFGRLVVGQIKETLGPSDNDDPVEHYLAVVADKTGSLIATSGRFGALMSGASPEVVEVMTTYGEQIGVAFQLADDVLDVSSDSRESGKTPGTDLREGIRTLPVLHALSSTNPADAELQDLLRSDLTDDVRHARALDLLRVSDAMSLARADLQRHADAAREVLQPLPRGAGQGCPGVTLRCGDLPRRLTRLAHYMRTSSEWPRFAVESVSGGHRWRSGHSASAFKSPSIDRSRRFGRCSWPSSSGAMAAPEPSIYPVDRGRGCRLPRPSARTSLGNGYQSGRARPAGGMSTVCGAACGSGFRRSVFAIRGTAPRPVGR